MAQPQGRRPAGEEPADWKPDLYTAAPFITMLTPSTAVMSSSELAAKGTLRFKTIENRRIASPKMGLIMRSWIAILCKRDLHAVPKLKDTMNPVPDFSWLIASGRQSFSPH